MDFDVIGFFQYFKKKTKNKITKKYLFVTNNFIIIIIKIMMMYNI